MRTTIHLADGLLKQIKRFAGERGQTFTAVVEESLRATLAGARQGRRGKTILLTTSRGEFRRGLDLDRSAALLDAMEKADAVD